MATQTTALTLAEMRRHWIGRKIYGSTDHQLDGRPPTMEVTDVHLCAGDGLYYAWSGEHHRAATLEALDRRLHQLAGG